MTSILNEQITVMHNNNITHVAETDMDLSWTWTNHELSGTVSNLFFVQIPLMA